MSQPFCSPLVLSPIVTSSDEIDLTDKGYMTAQILIVHENELKLRERVQQLEIQVRALMRRAK